MSSADWLRCRPARRKARNSQSCIYRLPRLAMPTDPRRLRAENRHLMVSDEYSLLNSILYTSARSILAQGPEALHQHYSNRMEKAMGRALPQMEVRFKNLSLSTDVPVSGNGNDYELPSLANTLKHGVKGLVSGNKDRATKHILKNVSGVFKPGTMTLVLGQPGSGKSALLKMLSGRFPLTKNIQLEGVITYNGTDRFELADRLPQFVTYVTQRDCHYPTLTVKETLQFAHECCGSELPERDERLLNQGTPEENEKAINAARALYKLYPDVMIKQLGLEHCQDTVVGDAMLRGVSGGERKRVTTGEMEFGNRFVTLMDEISTGLDSAATYDIVKAQRSAAKKLRKTVVIALLQPSPEVFELFDEVLILNKGHVMYHGPREHVMPYFRSLGFLCPPGRDVADFLLDLGTEQQHVYESPGVHGRGFPRAASEYVEIFQQSWLHQRIKDELDSPHDPMHVHDAANHFSHIPEFHQTFWASILTLMKRESKVILRNKALLRGRAVVVLVMALIYSSLLNQFDPNNIQVVLGTVFPALLFFGLNQTRQIPLYIAAREIFYKQRRANFYRTPSYVLATTVSQIPLALVEVLVFSAIVYWICGFVSDVSAYFVFQLVLFVTNLAFGAWFFFISSLCPNFNVAQPVGMLSMLLYILFAGFLITKDDIPVYFIWLYWLNPVAWGLRSLAINQYMRPEFDVCTYNGVEYCKNFNKRMNVYLLESYNIQTEDHWLGYGILFLAASFVVYMSLAAVVLERVRHESPEMVTIDKDEDNQKMVILSSCTSAEIDFEMIETPRQASKREIVLEMQMSMRDNYFTPVTLAFKDLWYSVPDPKNPKGAPLDLLKGISGFATPGTITALMGSSGAGKTTLMDVVAGRKTGGKSRGEILLNGYPATELAIRRATGYCEQMDIHSEASTIREALMFSAFLRQGSRIPDEQKFDSVEEALDLLDLRPIADQIIRGGSVEQMKRLTIGVELAAQPSVLFLDEPTSGLDARSAKVIIDGVRKVANTGRTVVCTIHQPSLEVFSVFDNLLLLKRGGQTVYFGELGSKACELVKYFEAVPGVSPLPNGYNPATWMLEVIGAGVGKSSKQETDFVSLFDTSSKKKLLDANLDQPGVCTPAPGISPLEFTSKRAASNALQAKFLIRRFMTLYWRTPSYTLTKLVINLLLGVVFGLSFSQIDYDTQRGINAGVGMVFTVVVFLGVVSFDGVMPISMADRAAFYRERASETYNALWYFVGGSLAEVPYVFGGSFLFTAIFFPAVGLTGIDRFFFFWFILSFHMLLQTYVGQCVIYALPTVEVAKILGAMITSIFFLFMGFNPPASVIPTGYKWLYHIAPPKYTLTILSSSLFGDCPSEDSTEIGCRTFESILQSGRTTLTVKQYLESVFWIKHDELWTNFLILIACIIIFRILGLLALRFINHQKN